MDETQSVGSESNSALTLSFMPKGLQYAGQTTVWKTHGRPDHILALKHTFFISVVVTYTPGCSFSAASYTYTTPTLLRTQFTLLWREA